MSEDRDRKEDDGEESRSDHRGIHDVGSLGCLRSNFRPAEEDIECCRVAVGFERVFLA